MSFREWTAVLGLAVQVVLVVWLVLRVASDGPGATIAEAAWILVGSIAVMIVVNIVATIAFVIAASIAGRGDLKDEAADERDRAIAAKSMRNAYYIASGGGAVTLVLLAFGYDPVSGVYFLFTVLMLAAAAEGISQLVYYRIG